MESQSSTEPNGTYTIYSLGLTLDILVIAVHLSLASSRGQVAMMIVVLYILLQNYEHFTNK